MVIHAREREQIGAELRRRGYTLSKVTKDMWPLSISEVPGGYFQVLKGDRPVLGGQARGYLVTLDEVKTFVDQLPVRRRGRPRKPALGPEASAASAITAEAPASEADPLGFLSSVAAEQDEAPVAKAQPQEDSPAGAPSEASADLSLSGINPGDAQPEVQQEEPSLQHEPSTGLSRHARTEVEAEAEGSVKARAIEEGNEGPSPEKTGEDDMDGSAKLLELDARDEPDLVELICGAQIDKPCEAAPKFFAWIRERADAVPDARNPVWTDMATMGWGQVDELELITEADGKPTLSPAGRDFVAASAKRDPAARMQRTTKLGPFGKIAKAQLGGNPRLAPDVARFAVLYMLAFSRHYQWQALRNFMRENSHLERRGGGPLGEYFGGAKAAREELFGSRAETEKNRKHTAQFESLLIPAGERQRVNTDTRGLPKGCRIIRITEVVADGVEEIIFRSGMPTKRVEAWAIADAAKYPDQKPPRSNRRNVYRDKSLD